MYIQIFLYCIIIKPVYQQLNGDFWWLNNQVIDYKKVKPEHPRFEELSEFDNDENSKIVFKENDWFSDRPTKNKIEHAFTTNELNSKDMGIVNVPEKRKDEFVFTFPSESNNTVSAEVSTVNKNDNDSEGSSENKIIFNEENLHSNSLKETDKTENICTYMKKSECFRNNGIVHISNNNRKEDLIDQELTCCVLPSKRTAKDYSSIIYFPDSPELKRFKRADDESISVALKQRNVLLQRKFSSQNKPISTPQTKIVTPDDDYVDPYWNIKNSHFLKSHKQNSQHYSSYDYGNNDYGQEYADELPRPGFVGLYSDHGPSPSSWTFTNNQGSTYGGTDDYEGDDDGETIFGYSTIDPRKVEPKVKRKKPVKLTTSSDEVSYNAESQTINFQSHPDFQVFQGFKLLNLVRNKSKLYTINIKKATGSSFDNSEEFLDTKPIDRDSSEIEYDFVDDQQVYDDCGEALEAVKANDRGKQIGDARNGSHPWMALVVPTKKRQNLLCYAALVHLRAAITTAYCVYGTSPGDVSLITGLWDLNERSGSQSRKVNVKIHHQYRPGSVTNNLSLLHWMYPLKLNINVKPACVSEPTTGDNCKFYGWGGFDQAIRQRSRWQRASVRACNAELDERGAKQLSSAFCASVQSRSTVTGLGGPLICAVDGHQSIAGVVVSRDSTVVLLPARDWTLKAIKVLSDD